MRVKLITTCIKYELWLIDDAAFITCMMRKFILLHVNNKRIYYDTWIKSYAIHTQHYFDILWFLQ